MRTSNVIWLTATAAAGTLAAAASAANITNSSFENPSVGSYDYTLQSQPQTPNAGDITNFVSSSGSSTSSQMAIGGWGIDQLATNGNPAGAVGVQVPANAPDGTQTAFSNGAHAIYQDVGTLQASTVYTLSVSIGDSILQPSGGGPTLGTPVAGTIELVNGTDDTGTVLGVLAVAAPSGGFTRFTLPAVTIPALASGDLTIVLENNVAEGGTYSTTQINFDSVTLTAETPEPSGLLLSAGCAIGLLVRRRARPFAGR